MTQDLVLAPANEKSSLQEELDRSRIFSILRKNVRGNEFIFYEAIGNPIGKIAENLFEFCRFVTEVSSESLIFHMKRGDFEIWIRDIIGDIELANRISKIMNDTMKWEDVSLRNQLHGTVRNRIIELQELLTSADL